MHAMDYDERGVMLHGNTLGMAYWVTDILDKFPTCRKEKTLLSERERNEPVNPAADWPKIASMRMSRMTVARVPAHADC